MATAAWNVTLVSMSDSVSNSLSLSLCYPVSLSLARSLSVESVYPPTIWPHAHAHIQKYGTFVIPAASSLDIMMACTVMLCDLVRKEKSLRYTCTLLLPVSETKMLPWLSTITDVALQSSPCSFPLPAMQARQHRRSKEGPRLASFNMLLMMLGIRAFAN